MRSTVQQGRGALFSWTLRSHLVGVLVAGGALGFSVFITAVSYLLAARALHESIASLGTQAQGVATPLQFLTGPVQRLDTMGGYLSYKVFGTMLLILGIYAAVQGVQLVRGAENSGLFDLWYAAGQARTEILLARAMGFIVPLFLILAGWYLGTLLGGLATGNNFLLPALGQCTTAVLVAGVACSLGFVISQFTQSTRKAAAIAVAYLVGTYFIANLGAALGSYSFIRLLSPAYYYLEERTLVPGHYWSAGPVLILFAATVVLALAGWLLYRSRDCDGVVVALVDSRPPVHNFRGGSFWRGSLALSFVADQWIGALAWFFGVAAVAAMEAYVVPAVGNLLSHNAAARGLVTGAGALATRGAFISSLMSVVVLIAAGFVVSQVSLWVGAATSHQVDCLLIQPISLGRFVLARLISLVLLLAGLACGMALGLWAGAWRAGYGVDLSGLLRSGGDMVLMCLAAGAVGLFLCVWLRSALATTLAALLVAGFFILTALCRLLSWPSWVNQVTLFGSFGNPYQQVPPYGGLLFMVGLVVLGGAASYLFMRFRDRVAP